MYDPLLLEANMLLWYGDVLGIGLLSGLRVLESPPGLAWRLLCCSSWNGTLPMLACRW